MQLFVISILLKTQTLMSVFFCGTATEDGAMSKIASLFKASLPRRSNFETEREQISKYTSLFSTLSKLLPITTKETHTRFFWF